MKCREFCDRLHEYLDGTLDPAAHAEARAHVERCPECRLSLQRAQAFGHAVQHALDQAAASISLQPELTSRILAAARAAPIDTPAEGGAWQWFQGGLFRALAAGATLLLVLLLTLQFRRQQIEGPAIPPRDDRGSYLVDVPHPIETHVFRMQNGSVVDAVVNHVAVSHAQFFLPAKTSSPPP